jgi:hypothetical protein
MHFNSFPERNGTVRNSLLLQLLNRRQQSHGHRTVCREGRKAKALIHCQVDISRENVVDHFPMHIRQAAIDSVLTHREIFMIDP